MNLKKTLTILVSISLLYNPLLNAQINSPDLTGYWPLEDTYTDYAGQVNNKPTNVVGDPEFIDGPIGRALEFGLNDGLIIPNQAELNVGTGDFTIAFWIKSGSSIQTIRTIIDKRFGPFSSQLKGFVVYLYFNSLGIQLADQGFTNYNTTTAMIPGDNSWHLAAISVDRDNPQGLNFYLNGILKRTLDPRGRDGDLNNPGPLSIAREEAFFSNHFNGGLDDIRIYKRALSGLEISSLMTACPAPTNPISTSIQSTSAIVSWDLQTPATSYLIRGGTGSYNPLNSVELFVPSESLQANSLSAAQDYYWDVATVCNGQIVSGFSPTQFFTTPSPVCQAPPTLEVQINSSTSATLTWDDMSFAVNYVIRGSVGIWDKSNLVYAQSSNSSLTISGLTPGESYFWQVQTVCNGVPGQPVSAFSQVNSFTMPRSFQNCLSGSSLPIAGIYPLNDNDFDCIEVGSYLSDTLSLKIFDTLQKQNGDIIALDSIRFRKINPIHGIPCGISYEFTSEKIYLPNDEFCIPLFGTPNDNPGLYSVHVVITAAFFKMVQTGQPFNSFGGILEFLDPNYAFRIRLKSQGDNCVVINPADSIYDGCSNLTLVDSKKAFVDNYQLVNIYPNPSDGCVSITHARMHQTELTIFNQIGQLVFQESISGSTTTIDLSNQAKGLYFIKISGDGNNYTEKIIIK